MLINCISKSHFGFSLIKWSELTTFFFVKKGVFLTVILASAFHFGQAQNKIIFSDSEVSAKHHAPAGSPLGKVDKRNIASVEKNNEYGVNSIYDEHGPLVEPGEGRLFFSRSNHPDNVGGTKDAEDIWTATWDPKTHTWTKVERLPPPLNNRGPNFVTSITVEEGVINLILGNTYENGEISGEGLSYSELRNGKWTTPANFTIKGFKNKSGYADFFVSEDGKHMLISAEMDDSRGGRDIYISHRVSKKAWDTPINLGVLNTPGEDTSPSFSPDGRFLFYSSDGQEGYGGLDIFYSVKQGDNWNEWSGPKNLGNQFNDRHDNKHFSLPPIGEKIYFVSGNEQGNQDIYSFVTTSEELYSELTGEDICFAEKIFTNENAFSHKLTCNLCVDLEYQSESNNGDVKYRWDFGDSFGGEGQSVSHCYDAHGTYDIKLSILEASTSRTIYEIDHEYELNEFLELKMDEEVSGVINEASRFKSHLAGAYPANAEFYWDFGDGYFACGNEVSHTYILPNDYEVRALASFQWQGRVRYLMTTSTVSVKLTK
ncbi:MAG: PKD domain-containing protein [Imperialibacter sp.]|uniref:PKD domain-containing protein n=1 Tax=Imperialibacter sp. TaxID=2038411 RepID=UPI0032F08434